MVDLAKTTVSRDKKHLSSVFGAAYDKYLTGIGYDDDSA